MVRRSSLVYELLKSERRDDGFTPKEIIDRVSQTYEITAGKALRKQVAVALRRGIDFGIIAKKNNKYRFDPGSRGIIETWEPLKANRITNGASGKKNNGRRKKKNVRRTGKAKGTGQGTSKTGDKQQKRTRLSTRRPVEPVPPKPKVPRPPNWNPKRRILTEEPMPKVVKHPSSNENSS